MRTILSFVFVLTLAACATAPVADPSVTFGAGVTATKEPTTDPGPTNSYHYKVQFAEAAGNVALQVPKTAAYPWQLAANSPSNAAQELSRHFPTGFVSIGLQPELLATRYGTAFVHFGTADYDARLYCLWFIEDLTGARRLTGQVCRRATDDAAALAAFRTAAMHLVTDADIN
jgi:hypothetical protein